MMSAVSLLFTVIGLAVLATALFDLVVTTVAVSAGKGPVTSQVAGRTEDRPACRASFRQPQTHHRRRARRQPMTATDHRSAWAEAPPRGYAATGSSNDATLACGVRAAVGAKTIVSRSSAG